MPLVLAAVAAAATAAGPHGGHWDRWPHRHGHETRGAPCVPLRNAAVDGACMPVLGLGVGGYGGDKDVPGAGAPGKKECWWDFAGCTGMKEAMLKYAELGGRRFDDANSYFHENSTQAFLAATNVPRSEIYITNKIGGGLAYPFAPPSGSVPPGTTVLFPFGYDEAKAQIDLLTEQTGYSDLLMTHYPHSGWPGVPGVPEKGAPQSTDPHCNTTHADFDLRLCRLATYRAMLDAMKAGKVRAVGVSNYNQSHIQEIIDAGLPLPAVIQNPHNPHRHQQEFLRFCKEHGILLNGYSPLGVVDAHDFPTNLGGAPNSSTTSLLDEPVLKEIARKHRATVPQVLVNWQWKQGAVTNPRSNKESHMRENLRALDFTLDELDVAAINTIPDSICDLDPFWYECVSTDRVCTPLACNFNNVHSQTQCLRHGRPTCDKPGPECDNPYPEYQCWPTDQ